VRSVSRSVKAPGAGSGVPAPPGQPPARPAPDAATEPADARRDRWSAHRAARRAEFVAAALRVLATQGTDLTMDAVAAEAGVTKPVLYRYFSDKAALVAALAEHGTSELFARLLPAIERAGEPSRLWIRNAVGAYFEVIDENPNLYWLLAQHSAGTQSPDPDPFERNAEFIATTLTAVIGDYLRAFNLDSGAAEPWAHGITGLVRSTGEWWLRRRSMSRVHVVEYVTRLVWSALYGVLHEAGIAVDPDRPLPVPAAPAAEPAPAVEACDDGAGPAVIAPVTPLRRKGPRASGQ
jgi:AcrR family transcriptional regulator